MLFLDESNVASNILDIANERETLTEDQSKIVRNLGMIWNVALCTLGIPIATVLYYYLWIWQTINQNLRHRWAEYIG